MRRTGAYPLLSVWGGVLRYTNGLQLSAHLGVGQEAKGGEATHPSDNGEQRRPVQEAPQTNDGRMKRKLPDIAGQIVPLRPDIYPLARFLKWVEATQRTREAVEDLLEDGEAVEEKTDGVCTDEGDLRGGSV